MVAVQLRPTVPKEEPDEKPTWTAGAILLAADALTGHTAAANLFSRVQLPEEEESLSGDSPRRRVKAD